MSQELVTRDALAGLPSKAAQEAQVTLYLERARDSLSWALDNSGVEAVAQIKAEIATAAEATKQLHLSQEIQTDSTEMVRRAEFTLSKAIRKGQEEGTVSTLGRRSNYFNPATGETTQSNLDIVAVTALLPHGEDRANNAVYASTEPEQFEEALTEARAENNVSRANVVRKIKARQTPAERDDTAKRIAEMAEQGHSTRQIAPALNLTEAQVTRLAGIYGIEIKADQFIKNRRRIDSGALVDNVINSLEHTVSALDLADFNNLSREQIDSLNSAVKALSKAINHKIKESNHA